MEDEDDESFHEWVRREIAPNALRPTIRTKAELHQEKWPGRPAMILTGEVGEVGLVEMRWGVWPFYSRGKAQLVTNARGDGLLSKPLWKNAVKTRRCLVPATGYFEPGPGPKGRKGEVLFTVRDRRRFWIAGLWDTDPTQMEARAFALVTTEPNPTAARFHDRMPVVLSKEEAEEWIGDQPLAEDRVRALCRGLPAEDLLHEVIPAAPKTAQAATTADEQPGLF